MAVEIEPSPAQVCQSARATRTLAARLGRKLAGGAVLALKGELGAGKTTFVQGLAEGLGVPAGEPIVSPTYTLVNEYVGGRLTLVHLDFYRINDEETARGLGLEEQIGRSGTITAVEWADLWPDLIPEGALWIELTRASFEARVITLGGA